MNKIYRTLQRKFGRFAIKNLIVYILASYAVGYILALSAPELYSYLVLNPAAVMKGEIWRLFTWIFTIPEEFNYFLLFMFLFYYYVGTRLEKIWGSFGYNFYVFAGMLIMVLSAMIIYWTTGIAFPPSTYYINLTSFLAYAFCFPELKVFLFMVIPIKVKWLAYIDLIYMGYQFLAIGQYSVIPGGRVLVFAVRTQIISSLLNFIIFYFMTKDFRKFSPKEIKRRKVFEYKVNSAQKPLSTKHKCAICGKTEKDGDNITFRYCSKCNGSYEFCDEHLYTHKHFE